MGIFIVEVKNENRDKFLQKLRVYPWIFGTKVKK